MAWVNSSDWYVTTSTTTSTDWTGEKFLGTDSYYNCGYKWYVNPGPAPPPAPVAEPEPEYPEAPLAWLDKRVDEMRVSL